MNREPFRMEAALAAVLATHPGNVGKGLGRFNVLHDRSHESWCDIPVVDVPAAIALAATPKRHRPPDQAASNAEYMRWVLSGPDGKIDPAGFEKAQQQRRDLLKMADTGEKQPGFASAPSKKRGGETVAPQSAGLPSSIAGWTNLTGYAHPVGRVNDLLIDNTGTTTTRTLWAGTDGGGIWKSTNGGTTWMPINDFNGSLVIGKIVRSPRNGSEMYASTNPYGSHGYSPYGILKSNDGGNTWNQLAATSPAGNVDWEYVTHLAIHPAGVGGLDVLLAATYAGVFQSTDSGATWSKIISGFASYVGFHPTDGNRRAYTLNDGKFRITTDGNWANAVASNLLANGTGSYTKFAFAKSDVNIVYAVTTDSGGLTNVVRSADGGANWSVVPTPATAFFHSSYLYFTGGIWVDPFNPNRIVVLEARAIATANATTASSTSGWVQSNVLWIDHHGVAPDPQYDGVTNKIVYLMDDGGIYRYADVDTLSGGTTIALGMTVSQLYDVGGRAPGPYAFAAQDVGVRFYRATVADPVLRWRLRTAGPGIGDGARVVADPTNPTTLYATTQYLNLHRTTDGGVNTALICQGITDVACTSQSGNAAFIPPVVIDPNNAQTLYAGAASLWRTTNATAATPSWGAVHSGVGSVVAAIAVAASDSNIVWVAYQNGRVYKSTNALSSTPTFTQVMGLPGGSTLRVFIDRVNPQRVFVGLGGFAPQRLQMTSNGGGSWTFATGLPNASVHAIEAHPAKPDWLYVGTTVGLFTSENGGATWTGSNEGPANVQVSALHWYSEFGNTAELLVGTFGRGVWRATVTADNGFLLTVNKSGAGGGTVTSGPAGISCGTTCANSFAANASVTLVASPNVGSIFTGWSGGGCSGTGSCTVTMSTAQNVTASFALSEPFPAGCTVPTGWATSGGANAGWAVASDRARTGTCSLKSGVIGNGTVSTPAKAQIQVTGSFAAGTLSFYYNVSSELNWDCLRLIVDTQSRAEMGSNCAGSGGSGQSGNVSAWTQVSVPLAAGTHTIVWSFERDSSGAGGSDAAWIDDVVLPPQASAGSVQFVSASATVNEVSNAVNLIVTRTGGSSGAASVGYATANGTATAGSDYAALSGTLTWADGDTGNRTITVPIYNNAPVESAESFTVILSGAVGVVTGSPVTATVTIVEGALVPDAPVIGTATPGNGEALIAFTPPAFNGGAAIGGYTATCVAGMQSVSANGASSPINVQGLTNGTAYACTVVATNTQGSSAPSIAANVTPDVNVPLVLLGAVSRMTHTGLGACDVPLDVTQPITGNIAIEPRLRHANHAIVFRFNNVVNAVGGASIVDAASLSMGTATPGPAGARELAVSLSGTLDTKRASVAATGLNGTLNVSASLGFLVGDLNATRLTSASDLAALKSRSGQTATLQNCRFDLDASGAINAIDISAAKARSGLPLP